jgi:hypothetical protein
VWLEHLSAVGDGIDLLHQWHLFQNAERTTLPALFVCQMWPGRTVCQGILLGTGRTDTVNFPTLSASAAIRFLDALLR